MMESRTINKIENKKMDYAHELARRFEPLIKGTVAKMFDLNPDDLSLLLNDQAGVYLSNEEPDTLCSLVLGEKNGHLYLVAAKIDDGSKTLKDFKCDVVS